MENHKKRKSSTMMIMAGLLVVAGFGAYQLFATVYAVYRLTGNWNWGAKVYPISAQGQPSIGDSNAPVKLVEFGDFKCYHCKEFHDQIFPQLKKDFIDTGKVEMYFINYAFVGEDSKIAAAAGKSVFKQNQAAFWKFYDAVYSHQKDVRQIWATPAFLVYLVQKYIPEVDANQVSEDLKNKTYEHMVLVDNNIAPSVSVDEVPKVFVNGKMVKDSSNYSALKKMIEDELKKK
jgi:protein-disulfide isomerase